MNASRHSVIDATLAWHAGHARILPWREPEATPWGVMVSEFMLQQTPVARVLPVWSVWMERWPTPSALAADEPGEAVRAWGRLGYPRRAQRLHAAATVIVAEHGGQVPAALDALRALPGVGEYTAAAIASFGYGQRHLVLDTNVRRVLARIEDVCEFPPTHLTQGGNEIAARAGSPMIPLRRWPGRWRPWNWERWCAPHGPPHARPARCGSRARGSPQDAPRTRALQGGGKPTRARIGSAAVFCWALYETPQDPSRRRPSWPPGRPIRRRPLGRWRVCSPTDFYAREPRPR